MGGSITGKHPVINEHLAISVDDYMVAGPVQVGGFQMTFHSHVDTFPSVTMKMLQMKLHY